MSDQRVLFFGDSLVAGVGDRAGTGWAGSVVAASFASGLPLTGYNLGVRGETSKQIASRWRAEAIPRLMPEADCRVVFAFGANDTTLEDNGVRVDADCSCDALTTVLDEAGVIGLPSFVVGPAPVDDPDQNHRIRELSVFFAAACAPRQVPFVGVVEPLLASPVWMAEVAAGDGAHPGTGGYEALAKLILDHGWVDWLRAPSE
ncbi:MAG: G-D-S-L family lipolytic protein [Solirubrobacterales bacterium]|nr:G-D-S-L family lipolytic protein [Solirubrobacterales bacterium]